MANIVLNQIILHGTKKDMKDFERSFRSSKHAPEQEVVYNHFRYSLNSLFPIPEHMPKSEVLGWCKRNWGTEGDIISVPVQRDTGKEMVEPNIYAMHSVNTPILRWLRLVSGSWPGLEFNYSYVVREDDELSFSNVIIAKGKMVESRLFTQNATRKDGTTLYNSLIEDHFVCDVTYYLA